MYVLFQPSARGGMGGGVVIERGGPALRPLRLVNKMVVPSPASRPESQDETLKDTIVVSGPGPTRMAADSGIDCSVASVGHYQDFAVCIPQFTLDLFQCRELASR